VVAHTIHKQHITLIDKQEINIHPDAVILSIQKQGNQYTVWYKTPPEYNDDYSREIYVVGTRHKIPEAAGRHLATIQDNVFVWHFFEGDTCGPA
jgi:hypothetical protein